MQTVERTTDEIRAGYRWKHSRAQTQGKHFARHAKTTQAAALDQTTATTRVDSVAVSEALRGRVGASGRLADHATVSFTHVG
ncbi:hypothetical protein D3C85_1455260 [compost metagenome]